MFALEFIRQRLRVEEEHFGAFKKSSDVKFPLKVGPFIFKNKSALLVVEIFLEVMDFQKEEKMNYDPHQFISQRRQLNKNKPFDHQVIEGFDKMDNLFSFEEDPEVMKEEMMEADEDKRDKLALTVQMSINSGVINKRTLSETGCMDMDEETSSKKIKMQPQNELINSEELSLEDLRKMVLFQIFFVQMQQYSFEDEGKI